MNEIVMVPIPVSPEAAAMLADAERLCSIGDLVSIMLRPSNAGVTRWRC